MENIKLSPAPVLTSANLLDHGKLRIGSQANMRIPSLEQRMFRLEFVQKEENTLGLRMTRHSQGEADKADQQMNSSQLCLLRGDSFAPSNN